MKYKQKRIVILWIDKYIIVSHLPRNVSSDCKFKI